AADVLTLHMPYIPENHHIIDAALLAKCKPGALFINTARGELVDAQALAAALQSSQLAGAGLDVVEETDRELVANLPNVILTPHNAFNSIEAIHRINETTVQSLMGFEHGKIPNKVA
ncbi:MAG TPA: NAD(P)-dependent oxidoreductase, partial [Candidatus Acidoferrum sp.]|nr:NAD(P)-dependent oxidoreductase [Candidatus Acidoferrum sp.]